MKSLALIFLSLSAGAQVIPFSDGPTYRVSAATAIAYRVIGSNATTSASQTYATTAANPINANSLVLCCVVSSLAAWAKPTGVSGCGLTWVEVTSTNYNGSAHGISLWRSMTNAATPSATVTATFANSQTGGNIWVEEFSNVDTSGVNGAGAIVQAVMKTNAIANPSLTLAAFGNAKNAGSAYFGNVANGFSGSPEAGWTEQCDQGYNVPATGEYAMRQLLVTDTTPTVMVGAQQWAGIAVEVKVKP